MDLAGMDLVKMTSGLILAGGQGRRVGGRDKGLVPWKGIPLAAHVAGRLRPQVGKLLISCNRSSEYYTTLADALVADLRPDFQGPLAGLEAAANQIESEFLLLAPCDTPRLPTDLAQRLLWPLVQPGAESIALSYAHDGERNQYLCAALRRSILPTLRPFLDSGQRAVRYWYALHDSCAVDFSDQAECFQNFNTLATK